MKGSIPEKNVPATSTIWRTAESMTVPVGPVICERSLTVTTYVGWVSAMKSKFWVQ